MTEEEKIICKQFLNDADKTHSCNEYKLLMALLEQEPTTKNDLGVDCIDRAEVLKLMQDNWHTHNGDWAMQESMDDIRALPSVTPQIRPKGHWIVQPSNKEQGERDFIWWKCSECGQVIFSETEHDRLEFHAFCGRCGADMRGKEE